jgi:hypothetical protein
MCAPKIELSSALTVFLELHKSGKETVFSKLCSVDSVSHEWCNARGVRKGLMQESKCGRLMYIK